MVTKSIETNPILLRSKFFTVNEAAEYLRVSVSAIYNWKSQGKLKGRKHGSRLLFTIDELDCFGESDFEFVSPKKFVIQSVRPVKGSSLKNKKKRVLEGHRCKENADGT